MSPSLHILIVEDDAVIAQLLEHHMIDMGHRVLDICHNGDLALDKIHNLKPDLILLDIHLEGTRDGIDLAAIIDQQYAIPYLFITALSDPLTLDRAARVNPVGYIVKPFREDDLRASIAIGLSNHHRRQSAEEASLADINEKALEPLSEKEFEILMDMSKGLTNMQIARRQALSTNTVKWHSQNIYSKLGVNNRTAAARWVNE